MTIELRPLAKIAKFLQDSTEQTNITQTLTSLLKPIEEEHGMAAALDALRLGLIWRPADADLLAVGVEFLFAREGWSEAADLARWSTSLGRNSANAHMTAAACLFRSRRLQEARHHGANAERLSSGNAGAKFLHGRILVSLGVVEDGLAKIGQAAEIERKFGFAARVLHLGLTTRDFEKVKRDIRPDLF
jgi:hypothetical protein